MAAMMWRNAACLVLGTGPIQYISKSILNTMAANTTIPLCIQENSSHSAIETEFLFVKRSNKTRFMANTHVFPGGVIDEADYSSGWINLFTHNVSSSRLFSPLISKSKLPIYETFKTELPGEIALRICAIRETFEETGVLLLRRSDQLPDIVDLLPGSFPPAIEPIPHDQLMHWRMLVHNDAKNFIAMCRELECVPDVFSLIEWSNWLTPSNYIRRYDTVFYICCMNSRPLAISDKMEVAKAEWLNLQKAVQLQVEEKLMLSPPQFIDICCILQLDSLSSLHSYALKHAMKGTVYRRVPVRIMCKDKKHLSLTQEDDLYPIEATPYKQKKTSHHHCQLPSLRDDVILKVVLDNVFYEYECPSHTADELERLSNKICRSVFGETETFHQQVIKDNVMSERISQHFQEYELQRNELSSKL